jgi:putative tryptophan/tyrosine transport system substrate-binding protein
MTVTIGRRELLAALGGAAATWPLAAQAQQRKQMRRVAVLLGGLEFGDASGQAEVAAFEQGLKELGWTPSRNIDLDYHWPGAQTGRVRAVAEKIAAAHPDLVLSRSTPATAALMHSGLPIVFVLVADPIGSGFVQNLGHPGRRQMARAIEGCCIQHLPGRALIQSAPFAEGYLHSAQAAAQTLGVDVISAPCGSDADIQRAFAARAREGNGGIIGIADTFVADHRDLIIALAAQHQLPAIFGNPIFARSGGLMAYSPDYEAIYRRAAGYVDRILRGARPAELPVQEPDKFTLSVNLKAARAIGLILPQTLVARADEVVE